MYERILLPTDGSEASRRAVEHAVGLADRTGAVLHVAYVVDVGYPYAAPEGVAVDWDAVVEALEEEGREATRAILADAEERGVEAVEHLVRDTSVPGALLELVEEVDVDLVVMGTHGRSGIRRFLMGSVTEKLLRSTDVPVLAVPMRPDDAEDPPEAGEDA